MIKNRYVILALLSGLNLVNYLDRFLVSAVGPKLQEELGLSDFRFGFIGPAFLVGYMLTSPFFGALGDRYARRGLIALGIAVWSLATVGSGLMTTFLGMIAARALVGVGEASYATLAPTIIDDLAPAATKNRWLAVFYVAIPVGSALGYVIGGMLEHTFGWRSAFFIAGGPGLVLALFGLFIREPPRAARPQANSGGPSRVLGDGLDLLAVPVYRSAVIGYTAQTFAVGGFSYWAPKYLYRTLGMELAEADFWFGLILVVTGLLATFVGGYLGDRYPGEDRARANLRVCAISMLVSVPFSIACLAAESPTGFFAAIAVTEFAIFLSTSPINVVILQGVPSHLRASAMALSIFAIHFLGDAFSPPLIGFLSDTWSLRGAMLTLPVALAVGTVAWWRGSAKLRPIVAN